MCNAHYTGESRIILFQSAFFNIVNAEILLILVVHSPSASVKFEQYQYVHGYLGVEIIMSEP